MPKTAAERQATLRAARAAEGRAEVRGIYLPKNLHAQVKQYAERLRRTEKS